MRSSEGEAIEKGRGENLGARPGWWYMAEAQEGFRKERMFSRSKQ